MQAVMFEVVKRRGKLRMLNPSLYQRVVDAVPEEKRLRLKLEEQRGATISEPMRRYYWAVVATMIAEATGHSKEALHEALKRKILGYVDEHTGLVMVPSVWSDHSSLSIQEKREFVDEVRRWAFDFLNLVIPDPQSVVY